MVEGSGFENRRIERYQGFESLRLRKQTPGTSGGLVFLGLQKWSRQRGGICIREVWRLALLCV